MRKVLLSILILVFSGNVYSQLRRDFSQIYRNAPYFNPAFAGIEDYFELNAGVQQAWSDLDDRQASVFVSAYGRIGNQSPVVYEKNSLRISDPSRYRDIARSRKDVYRKHGIGGRITSMSVGPMIQQHIMMSYAYHLPLDTRVRLSFGTNLSVIRQQIDLMNYTVRNETDDLFFQELIRQGDGASTHFNAGFGALLYGDRFFAGLSARSIVNSELSNSLQVEALEPVTTYTFMGGMEFDLSPEVIIRPGLKADYSDTYDLQWQPNLSLRWKETLSLGAYYAIDRSLTIALGLQLGDGLRFGYSYDHFQKDLSLINRNNHEITLSFFINNKYSLAAYLW